MQQEIDIAAHEAAYSYWEETPIEELTTQGMTRAMVEGMKVKTIALRLKFSKEVAMANPNLGSKLIGLIFIPILRLFHFCNLILFFYLTV